MTCHAACSVNKAPSKLVTSPSSHSAKKYIDSPDADFNLQFLYICGSWAKSHDTILAVPRAVETNARLVGTHMWKAEEKMESQCSVGVQCSGSTTISAVEDSCGSEEMI